MSTTAPESLPFQCQYCQRRFKRLEHVQRHERTHTKEAPYKCSCGKAFPRGDLLRRHEKSVHNVDSSKRKRASSVSAAAQDGSTNDTKSQSCATCLKFFTKDNSAESNLQSFNSGQAATSTTNGHRTSQRDTSNNMMTAEPVLETSNQQQGPSSVFISPMGNGVDAMFSSFEYPGLDPFDLFAENNSFLENVDFSSLFLPSGSVLDPGFPLGKAAESLGEHHDVGLEVPEPVRDAQSAERNAEQNSISRFGSPLPSIQTDEQSRVTTNLHRQPGLARVKPPWRISNAEYAEIEQKLAALPGVLPSDFILPSKHTISRYLEGCIRGLYEHMPLMHVPTWSVTSSAPELLLSMAAIGAQFRFEGVMAIKLFYAAKAGIMSRLRTSKCDVGVVSTSQAQSRHSVSDVMSPSSVRDTQAQLLQISPPTKEREGNQVDLLQMMQAIESLMVLASWGPRQLVGEAIAFQSLLAELVREDGLGPEHASEFELEGHANSDYRWRRWIRAESLRRTKLMAYTFINLQSVAYNVPPCILTSEIQFHTPASQDEWNAKTSEAWVQARRSNKITTVAFTDAFRSLFQHDESGSITPSSPSSAIGNYALVFAILQCIYFLREGCARIPGRQDTRNLRSEDIKSLSQALQNWQSRWEQSPESDAFPQSSSGPVAFNSTALLRLAWIRLHADLGPCRNLASRDATLIVEAFKSCPPLTRHPDLTLALLHAAHALSVPVRLGIHYVAKTQTVSWSVQHSLCNLECAIFLSKWFEAVASTVSTTPLTHQEVGIIHMIRSIVLETGFFRQEAFAPATNDQGWQRLIRHLGTAVAALWAEVFSGTHVFDMVSIIGSSLNIYAKLLENAHTPINGNV